jgi:hypothetical protein
VPADLVGDIKERSNTFIDVPATLQPYVENTSAWSIRKVTGWGARFSAPGYLDCTPWCVFTSEKAAKEWLDEQDDDDE